MGQTRMDIYWGVFTFACVAAGAEREANSQRWLKMCACLLGGSRLVFAQAAQSLAVMRACHSPLMPTRNTPSTTHAGALLLLTKEGGVSPSAGANVHAYKRHMATYVIIYSLMMCKCIDVCVCVGDVRDCKQLAKERMTSSFINTQNLPLPRSLQWEIGCRGLMFTHCMSTTVSRSRTSAGCSSQALARPWCLALLWAPWLTSSECFPSSRALMCSCREERGKKAASCLGTIIATATGSKQSI